MVVIVIAILLFAMQSLKYASLHSSVMDLGSSINNFYLYYDLESYGHYLLEHFSLYMILHSFITDVYMLFVVQMIAVIVSFVLIFNKSKISAFAFLLFFPVWFNVLFDFHIDYLSVPFTISFFFLIQSNRIGLAATSAIALALVKEPFALQTAMCGIYLFGICWKNRCSNSSSFETRKLYVYGLGLIIFGFGYFYISTSYIDALYSENQVIGLKSEAFSWLGASISEMFWYILTHPIKIFVEIFTTPGKVIYLVALFGALGFIPLLKPGPLIVALPILAISLLSRHEGYYGLGHHYTAGLIAPMIFAFAGGLPLAKKIWQRVRIGDFRLPVKWFVPVLVTGLIAAHIALAPSPVGRLFWSEKVWSYNYQAYIPTERDAMIKQAIADFIPIDPEVVVSIQNSVNWVPLMQRRHFLLFPQGIIAEQRIPIFGKRSWPPKVEWKSVMADFVVLDLKRPWFLADKGCEWLYGKCTNEKMASKYLDWVAKSRDVMDVVFEEDGFLILRKNNVIS